MNDILLPEWWRPRPLASHLGVSVSAIYAAIGTGELPARRMGPKTLIVRLEDARSWLLASSEPVGITPKEVA